MPANKALLEPSKDPHGRANGSEVIITDALHHPACSVTARDSHQPAKLGTPLGRELLSPCSCWMLAGCQKESHL